MILLEPIVILKTYEPQKAIKLCFVLQCAPF